MEEITINFAPRQKLPPGFRVEWWIEDEHYHWVNDKGDCGEIFSSRWQAFRSAWAYHRHFSELPNTKNQKVMYVPKSEFGWNRRTGWLHGDEASYNNVVESMKTIPQGRARQYPVHESWNEYLPYLHLKQRQFCAWAGLLPATFSGMKRKKLPGHVEELLSAWIEEQAKEESNE